MAIQKESGRWELRLGMFQVVILLGLIMGLLTSVFFLGYFSGRQVGHEAALSSSLSNTIKLPISPDDRVVSANDGTMGTEAMVTEAEASQRAASEVYAKLNESGSVGAERQDTVVPEVPRLGVIDTTSDAPIEGLGVTNHDLGAHDLGATVAPTVPVATIEMTVPTPQPREALLKEVIAESGSLGAQTVPQDDKVEALPEPTSAPTQTPTRTAVSTPTVKISVTPKATQTAKSQPAQAALTRGWYAQVAAPKKKEDASTLSQQLRRSGFAVVIEIAQVRGEQYFRILAGPENTKAQAEKLVEQLSRERYVPSKPFIRQVK
jgi:cell division septation protein DedD